MSWAIIASTSTAIVFRFYCMISVLLMHLLCLRVVYFATSLSINKFPKFVS